MNSSGSITTSAFGVPFTTPTPAALRNKKRLFKAPEENEESTQADVEIVVPKKDLDEVVANYEDLEAAYEKAKKKFAEIKALNQELKAENEELKDKVTELKSRTRQNQVDYRDAYFEVNLDNHVLRKKLNAIKDIL